MKNLKLVLLLLVSAGSAFAAESAPLPRLIDLGATQCVPCKKMVPELAALKTDYAGRLEVVFIDVWENPDAGKPYGIRLIPTQIFFDAAGKELFRHEGFWAKEAILAKFNELGIKLMPLLKRPSPLKPETSPTVATPPPPATPPKAEAAPKPEAAPTPTADNRKP